MLKFISFCCVLIAVIADDPTPKANKSMDNVYTKLITTLSNSTDDNKLHFPDGNITTMSTCKGGFGNTRYKVGARVENNQLVGFVNETVKWETLHDVELHLRYPKSGNGSILTFVQVEVDETSDIGLAYVVSGGIRQNVIEIVVKGKKTLSFRYAAKFYGY